MIGRRTPHSETLGRHTTFPEELYVVETHTVPWWALLCLGAALTLEIMGTIAEYRHKRTLHNRINRAEMVLGKQIRETRNVSEKVKNINQWRQRTETLVSGISKRLDTEAIERIDITDVVEPPNVEINKEVRAA